MLVSIQLSFFPFCVEMVFLIMTARWLTRCPFPFPLVQPDPEIAFGPRQILDMLGDHLLFFLGEPLRQIPSHIQTLDPGSVPALLAIQKDVRGVSHPERFSGIVEKDELVWNRK